MATAHQYNHGHAFDEYGLLIDPHIWNDTIARLIARRYGIHRLDPEHWLVIDTLREHYLESGVMPAIQSLRHTVDKDRYWVHELFGSCLNAWRIAGLPDPGEEIKSYLSDM